MSPYPDGTGAGDPNAPWNAPEPTSCPECDEVINEDDDHEDWCELVGMEIAELRERREEMIKADKAEDRLDEMRLEGFEKTR